MSRSNTGFKPVCVLYQGNGSQLDGTCQLVCRHQILAQNFEKGDIVEVATISSRDEDDSDSDSVDSPDRRRAIVMGDELVSSLLGTLFNAEVPQHNDRKRKRTSEGGDDRLHDIMDEVLATVRDIKVEITRHGQDLSRIKERQVKLESRLNLIQETIITDHREAKSRRRVDRVPHEHKQVVVITNHDNEQEAVSYTTHVDSPMITSVMSTTTGAKGKVVKEIGDSFAISHETSSQISATPSEEVGDGFEEVIAFEAEESIDVSGYTENAGDTWERYGSLPSVVVDRNEDYLKDLVSSNKSGNKLEIGTPKFSIRITVEEMEDYLYKTNNAASFAYRLAGKCFTTQEMLEGNTRGGRQRADGQIFKKLNPDAINVIIEEVKKRFPHSAKDNVLTRCVKNAINERARNERKRNIKNPRYLEKSALGSPN